MVLVFVMSGFRRDVDEFLALLGFYAALSGSSAPTFRDNLSGPFSNSPEVIFFYLDFSHCSYLFPNQNRSHVSRVGRLALDLIRNEASGSMKGRFIDYLLAFSPPRAT